MDPREQDVIEVILHLWEVELGMEREKTRAMDEWVRAVRAAVEAKEKERSMLMIDRDQILAVKEAGDKLVADFLEADDHKNFDGQKAMMEEIVALMSLVGGDGSNAEGSDSLYGGNINCLENTQIQDEGAVTATIEGKNSAAE